MLKKLILTFLLTVPLYVSAANDPYSGLKFYYGDNHFHSGFSGDNVGDAPPIAAFINAAHQVIQFGKDAKNGGDSTDELGGYFLFMSDHVKFVPSRQDMTDDLFQIMRKQADDPSLELKGETFTLTIFPGGELTGLRRNLVTVPPWDNKFGHLNLFNVQRISNFTTNGYIYLKGTEAMDRVANERGAIGQFNHPGYNDEPRSGDDKNSLYPYTIARDQVFKFFEVSDGQPNNWNVGAAQYNICLQKGYHVSPVIGSDFHDTHKALSFQPSYPFRVARTVIIAPSTLNMSHEDRRTILLESVRKGLVYATESPNLHIKLSLNGFLIGHQFDHIPDQLTFQIDVEEAGGVPLKWVQLVQNMKPSVPDDDISSENNSIRTVQEWSVNVNPELFQKGNSQFHIIYTINSKQLISLKYIYLKVMDVNDNRAMTTPFFFY
jgi:hypothetical protein